MKTMTFKDRLKDKMDRYVHLVYKETRNFPKEELYGVTSQLRRAVLSIILNYIEGYARRKKAVQLNFFEISYGSFKEAKYLLKFCLQEGYITKNKYEVISDKGEEIGAMLWTEIINLDKSLST